MRFAFTNCIEHSECAHQKVISRWGQPGPKADQALNGLTGGNGWTMPGIECFREPALEVRDAWAGDARERGQTLGCFIAGDAAREPFLWRTDCEARGQGETDVDQPVRRRAGGPIEGAPYLALVQREPNGVADRDTLAGDQRELSGQRPASRQTAKISNQCDRTIADIRLADTEE